MAANTDTMDIVKDIELQNQELAFSQKCLPPNEKMQDVDSNVPEGSLWGWMSVLGGFCLSVSTFGYIVSWGTFQAYYEEFSLSSSAPSAIAWIGSVQYSLIYFPGVITGRLFDKGYFRVLLATSSILFVVANFLVAQCRSYWQFLLCQGFALGIASGLIYVPCVALVSQWFKSKRPIAFSVVSFGVSVGGIIFPIMFRTLLPKIGFAWTVRVTAFVNLAMFTIAYFTMFTRPIRGDLSSSGHFIDFSDFKSKPFVFYVACTFTAFLGLYTTLTFLSVSAVQIGIDESLAFYLVAISNGSSALGRFLGGLYAFKYGPVNAMIFFTSIAGVLTYVWPFITSHSGFIGLSCVYGFSSGAFVGLFPVGIASLGSLSSIGRRAGMQMSIMSLGALAGPPISGAIFKAKGDFKPVGLYAGSVVALSIFFMFLTRLAVLGRVYSGRI